MKLVEAFRRDVVKWWRVGIGCPTAIMLAVNFALQLCIVALCLRHP